MCGNRGWLEWMGLVRGVGSRVPYPGQTRPEVGGDLDDGAVRGWGPPFREGITGRVSVTKGVTEVRTETSGPGWVGGTTRSGGRVTERGHR